MTVAVKTPHVPDIRPSGMVLFKPTWAPTCSCGWDPGGSYSERNARNAGTQHAKTENAAG